MNRRIAFAVIVLFGLLSVAVTQPVASAAPQSVEHQVIASVLFQQDSGEAQLSISTVDGSRLHRINRGALRRGIILADDDGRLIALRGDAGLVAHARSYQVFHFDDVRIDMPGRRVVRLTHFSFAIVTGDFVHPTFICGSPSLSIDDCLGQWHP